MDTDEIIINAGDKMDNTIKLLRAELNTIRAGRANPQLLDNLRVDYYGTPTPIKQVANISAPEPRMLVISPWDGKMIPIIEKAIRTSDLGINPINDGKLIRLAIPELTEERRRQLVKLLGKQAEEARISVRNVRREANDQLKRLEKAGDLTEDDLKQYEKDVQEITDEHIKAIDEIVHEKEKEIMRV